MHCKSPALPNLVDARVKKVWRLLVFFTVSRFCKDAQSQTQSESCKEGANGLEVLAPLAGQSSDGPV